MLTDHIWQLVFILVAGLCQILQYDHVMVAAAPMKTREAISSLLEMTSHAQELPSRTGDIAPREVVPFVGAIFSGPPGNLPSNDDGIVDM